MQKHAIHYCLIPADPYGHLYDVCVDIQQPDPDGQIVSLPNWIPGSYMIRDFAKHLIDLRASTLEGEALTMTSRNKSEWQIAPTDQPIQLRYQVYAWDLSVRGAHFDQTHGFFNGTSCFLMVEGQRNQAVSLEIKQTDFTHNQAWCLATALKPLNIDSSGFGLYHAQDYDELIDHPVEMGLFTQAEFVAAGIKHRIVLTGKHDCDLERLCADLTKICTTQLEFFGQPAPFDAYLFMVMVVGEGYGGLEHRSSTALVCSRDVLPYRGMDKANDSYLEFLELCSHEYFHSWNVKRIMPAQFQTPDLSQPAYTEQLWWFEGATSVYDLQFLLRAGIIDHKKYLNTLAQQMTRVYRMPGRFKQSVSESSFHSWTKFYQQDENAPNAIISYYTKGALIALGLDFEIRRATQNQKTLDDLLLTLWQDYGLPQTGLQEGEIERLASALAGTDLTAYFDRYLRGTDDLPFEAWFADYGIHFTLRAAVSANDQGGDTENNQAWLNMGANLTNTEHQTIKLTHVWQQRPAHLAGLSANDEIIAINDIKTPTSRRSKKS
jgi:predicted metalloprotease with PDZ domain